MERKSNANRQPNRQEQNKTWQIKARRGQAKRDRRTWEGSAYERAEGWNHYRTKQAELQRIENKTNTMTRQHEYTIKDYVKAQKSCATHKHVRKKQIRHHFGRSSWKFRFCLKNHQNWQFMKIDPPKSETPFQSISIIRRSNIESFTIQTTEWMWQNH